MDPNQQPLPPAPQPPPAPVTGPVQQPVAADNSGLSQKQKFFLILWISSIPASIVIGMSYRLATGGGNNVVVNLLTLFMGLYFFVGWIPFLIVTKKKE